MILNPNVTYFTHLGYTKNFPERFKSFAFINFLMPVIRNNFLKNLVNRFREKCKNVDLALKKCPISPF